MGAMRLVLSAFVVLAVLAVWDQFRKPAELPQEPHEYSRFQLVSGTSFALALDTKTGELCHTYDSTLDDYIPDNGIKSSIVLGHPSLDSIPLCLDLSQNELSTVESLPQHHHPSTQPKASSSQ